MTGRQQQDLEAFGNYLLIERSLSVQTSAAYRRDVQTLTDYLDKNCNGIAPENADLQTLRDFLYTKCDASAASQARLVSGIRAYYRYLLLTDRISENPAKLLESPKLHRKLPQVLSFEEIEAIERSFDLSMPEQFRNKTIIELMYSCGLRVSEVVSLPTGSLHLKEGFISVIGKGNKERLVPIGQYAAHLIRVYMEEYRPQLRPAKECQKLLFLNRMGKKLTREMVFTIVKKAAKAAGIRKNVSPHSFRHAFATHLVEGGADLRSVQEMLGHKNITTTEIYTHLDRSFLEKTIRNYHPRYKDNNEIQ
jgi:integrase/recombinase XerD